MREQTVAKAYAYSLMELGEEYKIDVVKEMVDFNILINENNDFENLLFLEVFTQEEKAAVLSSLFQNTSDFHKLLQNFLFLLIEEKRLQLLPLIFKEMVIFDDQQKGFITGVVEGREPKISDENFLKIKNYLRSKLGREPKLTYQQSDRITAGYRITAEDLQLDASVDHQFEILKSNILGEHER